MSSSIPSNKSASVVIEFSGPGMIFILGSYTKSFSKFIKIKNKISYGIFMKKYC